MRQTRPRQTRLRHPHPFIYPLPCLRMDEETSRNMRSSRRIPSTVQTSSREQDPLSRRVGLTPENPDSPLTFAVTHRIHQVWDPWRVKGGIVTNFPSLVRYLRLVFNQHAFACFVLISNVPFPYVNGMYFIHAYSSRPSYTSLPYVYHTSSTPMPHFPLVYIIIYRVVYSLASLCSSITKPFTPRKLRTKHFEACLDKARLSTTYL